jgi:hypothetical protein
MMSQKTSTRRSALKKGALAAGIAAGGIATFGTSASAHYNHTIRVEADSGDGKAKFVVNDFDEFHGNNVESDDILDRSRVWFYVKKGWWSSGYDEVHFNITGSREIWVSHIDDNVAMYLDGDRIWQDDQVIQL